MSDLTLREMLKLAKLKATDLADQMGIEYGQVSTAITMDANGVEAKRKSVKDRQALIREHLETMLKLEQRENSDDPKRRPELWDSPEIAGRRFPAPRGCAQTHSLDGFKLGQYVRLDLDQDGEPSLYRFLRVVTNERTGRQHADVIGGVNGACRSLTVEKLMAGVR